MKSYLLLFLAILAISLVAQIPVPTTAEQLAAKDREIAELKLVNARLTKRVAVCDYNAAEKTEADMAAQLQSLDKAATTKEQAKKP